MVVSSYLASNSVAITRQLNSFLPKIGYKIEFPFIYEGQTLRGRISVYGGSREVHYKSSEYKTKEELQNAINLDLARLYYFNVINKPVNIKLEQHYNFTTHRVAQIQMPFIILTT
jgi:hypothetical protein